MILVGLIPRPKEPKLDTNAFLEPLVEELKQLWKGVVLEEASILGYQVYASMPGGRHPSITQVRWFHGPWSFKR